MYRNQVLAPVVLNEPYFEIPQNLSLIPRLRIFEFMNKIYISILIFLFALNAFGQDFDDLIITKKHDSILCNITFVNDQNIFYEYKKKRKTKTDHISRDLILNFNSTKIEDVTFKAVVSSFYQKCDTCENYIVLFSNDTIYYDIEIHRFEQSKHILGVCYLSSNSYTTYIPYDLKSIYWDSIEYTPILLTDDDLVNMRYHILYHTVEKKHLGFYVVKGKVSLIEFSYLVNPILYYYSPFLVKNFLIEINNERIIVPKGENALILILRKYLKDNPELILRIENRELGYDEIEEIIRIYNDEN